MGDAQQGEAQSIKTGEDAAVEAAHRRQIRYEQGHAQHDEDRAAGRLDRLHERREEPGVQEPGDDDHPHDGAEQVVELLAPERAESRALRILALLRRQRLALLFALNKSGHALLRLLLLLGALGRAGLLLQRLLLGELGGRLVSVLLFFLRQSADGGLQFASSISFISTHVRLPL